MTEEAPKIPAKPDADASRFAGTVRAKAARKMQARRDGGAGVWMGLGVMGLIGWSVAVPTLAGAALGIWLDARHPGAHSWTLALLMAGLMVGCFTAWAWVARQDREMQQKEDKDV
jgi:ATP synthase protein I